MKQTSIADFFYQCKLPEASQKRKSEHPDSLKKSLKPELYQPKKSIIVVPPSKVANLSSSTLSVINSLNRTYSKPSLRSTDEILNSVSPREKYQDLLDPIWKLPLPYKFNRLLQIQNYTDTVINNSRLRSIQPTFTTIKQCIESTYNTYIDLEHIQKLLYLEPHLYKITKTQENDLIIDLPLSENYTLSDLHNRSSSIKSKLMNIVKTQHKAHLNTQNLNFDPEIFKTWHSSFNLHEIPDIPLSPLPVEISEEFAPSNQARVLRLATLCKTLLEIFKDNQTPSLFLRSLVKKISQKKKLNKEEQGFVVSDLTELCEVFCGWLCIIKTGSGDVVRMNKTLEFNLKVALDKIKEKYR